jgi:hypothetical protein
MKDNQKKYLDKVVSLLVRDTEIRESSFPGTTIMVKTPFTELEYSRPRYFTHIDACRFIISHYGVSHIECDYIYRTYILEMNDILISEWGIIDPVYH